MNVRTTQTAGCLKQCSLVSPPFTTTLSAQHMQQQPTTTLLLCHPPPIPPHFHPHHPTLTTYAHTSLAPLHMRTPSHSPFNAHYSPHVHTRPSHPQHLHTHPIPQHPLTHLCIDTPTHLQNMFDHNIRVHKQIRSTSCLSQFLLKRSTPWYNRLLAQSCSTHKGTLDRGHLSKGGCVCCPNHIELCTDLCTSELGTPLYTGQPVGSRQCPL